MSSTATMTGKNHATYEHDEQGVASRRFRFIEVFMRERVFLAVLATGFLIVGSTYENASIARWVGFALAGYSAVANDSIQTLGTFIASNKETAWYKLWLFIGGIFLLTMTYSWLTYQGDVSYGRLLSKGFESAPTRFHFLQVGAPLFLLILTRLRMPVSTTFLLLSSFATSGKSIGAVTLKSVGGYLIAFTCAIVVWLVLSKRMQTWFKRPPHPAWRVGQWVTTGCLWSVWLMQDAANVAIYLPRSLSTLEFLAFAGFMFLGLGVLFKQGGERIQEVVNEKSDVVDVRAATLIDFIYAVVLYVFKIASAVPMSTTWVFVGLLGGRELAMAIRGASGQGRGVRAALRLIGRDLLYVTIGFVVALLIAAGSNPVVAKSLF